MSRQNQSRRLTVEFNVRGRDLLSVVREAQAKVREGVVLPAAYRFDWGVAFIALFGVAVLNGLVLVSFTRHLERKAAFTLMPSGKPQNSGYGARS